MGQKISQIAYNEEFEDMKVTGLSKTQVALVKEYFYSICEASHSSEQKLTATALSAMLKIPREEAQLVVDFADIDGDGKLNDYDFVCLVGLFTKAPLQEKLEGIFYLFDEDCSQIISEKELEKLVRCILTVNENCVRIDDTLVQRKVEEILGSIFAEEKELKISEFLTLSREDSEFQNALLKLGIFRQEDFQESYNEDLEDEIGKGQDEFRDERYENARNGAPINHEGIFAKESVQADEFMAIKPFLGTIKNSVPSDFDESKRSLSEPDAQLSLEFVHGFRCFDTRNNIFYIDESNILFHSAAVGVTMHTRSRKQDFNFENSDDIIAIAKQGELVVTGQIGHKPIINLWSSITKQTFGIIVGDLEKGISHLALSGDGKLLAAVAMNDEHDIAVYNVADPRSPKLIMKSKGVRDAVLDVEFTRDGKQLILATKKELYFAKIGKTGLKVVKASGWGKNRMMCLAIGFLNGMDCVVGLSNGSLAVIKGANIQKQVPAHKKCVYAVSNNESCTKLFTGGADGKIIVFGEGLTVLQAIEINANGFKSINPKVRALDFLEDKKKLLIGTRGGEIIEYSFETQSKEFLLHGHFSKELWGLAVHPSRDEFVTVGEDFLLAKWSVSERKNILSKKMKYESNTLAISPSGTHIAIGCKNGFLLVLAYSSFQELQQKRASQKELTQVKFSPCGSFLAAGSRDSKIYIFDAQRKFKRLAICKGHHSTITHLDFSEDSQVLQSTCTSYELLYWNTRSGKQDTRGASANRDEKWASWTCVLGWPVQGIFPPCSDGTDVNSVDRTKNRQVIATGDDFGTVKLFKAPNFKGSSYNKFIGHSSHVTNVRFTSAQNHLISVGGNDKSVFQWRFIDGENGVEEEYEQGEEEEFLQIQQEEEQEQVGKQGMFDVEEEEAVEFMAVKPWVGDLNNSIPSTHKYVKGMEEAPDHELQLHYVNGYRCFDTRYAARITSEQKLVFASASLGIEMDHVFNTQTFFNGHDEDVVSFDLHPNRKIAATGQMAMKGRAKLIDIFVWDVENKQTLAHLKGFHLRAIQLLKFSPDGSKLYSFGKDDDNSLAVYDWENERLIATSKVDKQNVLDISFKDENSFLTVGSKHVKSWGLKGTRLQGSKVSWSNSCKPQAVLCCEGLEGFGFVVGTVKGNLIPVRGGMGKPVQAHKGKVYVMISEGKQLFSGGEDGLIKEWSVGSQLQIVREVVRIDESESLLPKIRALDVWEKQMLIGTGASELFIIENYTQHNQKKKILTGHYQGELWGLACHPFSDTFATCGDDRTVRIWSASKRIQLQQIQLPSKLRAIAFSHSGTLLATASMQGEIFLMNNELQLLQKYQSSFKKANQWIEELKFSPNDEMLAFGAHGGASKVEILKLAHDKLSKYAIINAGITSALLHLDWASDSSTIVVNSQAYELKFVDVFAKKSVRASSVRDIDWSTWTCKIGFPVQGIYPGVDGTDVNTVDRSKNREVLATGDDFQLVKLFKYPSVTEKSGFRSYKGHASHVTRVRFLQDDKYLISTGGNDKVSIIWKTSFENKDEEEEEEFQVVKKKVQRNKYGYQEEEQQVQGKLEIGGFEIEQVEETEFMAVKPWLGAIKPPSDFVAPEPDQNSPPHLSINLEHVYGYRARDCRNNLFLHNSELYYFAAALGICLNPLSNTQRFFQKHRDDVISMAFEPNRKIFATGELGPKPWICLWDASTLDQISVFKEGIVKGIQSLGFSPDGSKLAAVCIDDNNMIVVFDLQREKMIACEKGDTAKIVDMEWLSENEFVTVGMRHFKTWKLSKNGIKGSKGSFGKGKTDKLVFVKRFGTKVLCGGFQGQLQVWNGGSCGVMLKFGKGTVDAACVGKSHVYVGGKQKTVFVLDASLRKQSEICLSTFLFKGMDLSIRAIQVNDDETELYVGLYSSQIFRVTSPDRLKISEFNKCENLIIEELMTGHFARNKKWTNEVWGLYPLQDNKFLSVSDDATLRMWDNMSRKEIKLLELNIDKKGAKLERDLKTKDLQDSAKLRSVAVSPDQKFAAVGCKEGTVRIIDLKRWSQIKILKRRNRWIQTLRFSPDNSKLAVGSHDCFIDIYDVNANFKILHKMKKHSSFLTHLDWSEDSTYLHSNCGAYELLFWDAIQGRQITKGASALRDEQWATWSCVLGWPVQGVFKPEWDGSDVNMVDRSHKEVLDGYKVIACADDFSEIRVYKYPCLDKSAKGLVLKGHASHVTNVKFDENDRYLYSTGGEDQCVMQWKIE